MSQADKGQLWKGFNRVVEVARVEGGCIAYTWIGGDGILGINMCTLTEFYKFYEEFESDFIKQYQDQPKMSERGQG